MAEGQPVMHKPTSLERTIYFEVIEDFRTLHYGIQDKLIQELHCLYGPVFDFSEEYLARLFTHPKATTCIVILGRELDSSQLVASCIIMPFFFEHIENDHRPQNQFLSGHGILCVAEKYRINKLAWVIGDITEEVLWTLYPNTNIIEFGFMVSPLSFYAAAVRSKLAMPDGKAQKNPKIHQLFEKLKTIVPTRSKKVGDNPYVHQIFPPVKNDLDLIFENLDRLPRVMKYFVNETGLTPGYGLMAMQISQLVEGNTLELPAGQYITPKAKFKGQIRYLQGSLTRNKYIPKL
ncbi:hypothetical protein SteCoe_31921 [Stentor coeruleus]|uniref:Uncharacterized protein n=1 Tax=Stentor coeruleus TaxID=5963 RepID=A0A1R2B044_9CILI|nr:hypothetical protein SteCoe_31921 [Stentor coeruleus]